METNGTSTHLETPRSLKPGRQVAFPGFAIPKSEGSVPPRLHCEVAITITDNETKERLVKKIPGDFYRGTDLLEWVHRAIAHERTNLDIMSFVKDRDTGE